MVGRSSSACDSARMRFATCTSALLSALILASVVRAQSVGTGSGPLSEISRSVGDNSRPLHERGRSVRDGTVGSMKSGPVRDGRRLGMLSGPVSEISVGPVTAGRPMTGGGSVTENSAGAVKHEMDPSLGEQVYDLQRTLAPLQARLRQQAESEMLEPSAEAPVDSEVADEDLAVEELDTTAGVAIEPADVGADVPQQPETESDENLEDSYSVE